jgi:hypothetical protein
MSVHFANDETKFQEAPEIIFFDNNFGHEHQRNQQDIAAQLAVTLDSLGHCRNGMSGVRLAWTWGRSEGSIRNYTKRVFCCVIETGGQICIMA